MSQDEVDMAQDIENAFDENVSFSDRNRLVCASCHDS
jgi:hypothetical protein